MLVWIIVGLIALPFIIMGIFLINGKGAFLIAGFNTMSAEMKATYDTKALCKAVGWLLISLTVLMLLWPLSFELGISWLFWLSFALFMVFTIGFAIYANTGNRFKLPVDPSSPAFQFARKPMSRLQKLGIVIAIVLSAQLCIGIGIMIYLGERDPKIRFDNNYIRISGLYSANINIADIEEVVLLPENMKELGIGSRTNGYATTGHALKGHFSSLKYGQQLLFVYSSSSPTIQISRTSGVDVFISFRNGEATRSTYHSISLFLSQS